ncbi:hypothetical protein ACRAWD_15110 [Caulobacter segnis]
MLVAVTRFLPQASRLTAEDQHQERVDKPILGLFARPRFLFGVLAQFFYVGAQVGVWSYMIRYAQDQVPGMGEKTAAAYLSWSLVGFMAGRFTGTALMSRVDPSRLMATFAAINVGLTLVAVTVGGHLGLLALASDQLLHVDHVPDHLRQLAGRDLGRSPRPAHRSWS